MAWAAPLTHLHTEDPEAEAAVSLAEALPEAAAAQQLLAAELPERQRYQVPAETVPQPGRLAYQTA